MGNIKQVYINYKYWEDYINGMWRKLSKEDEVEFLKLAIEFTSDHFRYGKAMRRVIVEWPNTCMHNLSDLSINRKAFIGHCAVCIELNIPEYITRMAWGKLTDEQRMLANSEAAATIKMWEQKQSKKVSYEQIKIGF